MDEKHITKHRPAVIFGQKCVKTVGYIDDFIFACEIAGGDHIKYAKPRQPKYHLVIIILEGWLRIIINGKEYNFGKSSYVNLPVWAEIYEIEYNKDFHAMVTATDRTIIEDIYHNRHPLPPDFMLKLNHSFGGEIFSDKDIVILTKDIKNLIDSLNNKNHHFAEEVNYSYFYILLTDIADMMWNRYGKGAPSHKTDMTRSGTIFREFLVLLRKHVKEHTDVGFYAGQLCISKQYLSLVVKERTSVTIGIIISSFRAEVAARLLRDPELSIQEISLLLSFSDQSSFGKFFKKHSGLSPYKYRQGLKNTLLSKRKQGVIKFENPY